MLRRLLNALYDGAAALAAVAMVGLLVAVLLSIGSRQLGFNIPGIDSCGSHSGVASLPVETSLNSCDCQASLAL